MRFILELRDLRLFLFIARMALFHLFHGDVKGVFKWMRLGLVTLYRAVRWSFWV